VKLTNFASTGLFFVFKEVAAFGSETLKLPIPPIADDVGEVFMSVGEFSDCRHLNIIGLSGSITSSRTKSMMSCNARCIAVQRAQRVVSPATKV